MWDAKQRTQIVLEGLKGLPLTDLCRKHRIREAQYSEWRAQFLAQVPQFLREVSAQASLAVETRI